MKRILLVEDDLVLGETLVDCFQLKNYEVHWVKSVKEALCALNAPSGHEPTSHRDFDLALVDITLPDGNGFEVAESLANFGRCPFLFMTARNEAESRLRGFEMGAHDYVPKPFHFRELLIRIEKILAHQPESVLTIGDRIVNLKAKTLFAKDQTIVPLSHKDFSVLEYLIEHRPQIISRDELLDHIWGTDQYPTPRTVDNSILRIRKALQDTDGKIIHSMRGMGYQINI